jgi:hypothetical protein
MFQTVLNSTSEVQVQLLCSSLAVVQRYVEGISSKQLIPLPDIIDNDSTLPMELSYFATQLQNEEVHDMLLDR